MIIGIDGSEANEKVRVGSSEYSYQLLHALYRVYSNNKSHYYFRIFLKQEKSVDLPPENDFWKYVVIPSGSFWIIRKLIPRLMKERDIDLFFSPTHYLPIFTLIPQICTIHDVGYLMFSGQFKRRDFWQLKYWTAISLYISKYIISVSESTKKDIVRHYPSARKKIKTIYHGVDRVVFNNKSNDILVRQVKNKYIIRKNYILSIGTLKPSKNIDGIIKSFDLFRKEFTKESADFQLVISGKKGWLYDEVIEKIKANESDDKIIFTDYVDTSDKVALLKGAYALISPSFWEGFGMHILEAMACGKPVIVSRIGGIPEVAGDCGIYVDPNDPGDIEKGLIKLVRMDKSEYNKLSKACIERAGMFSWENTVKETVSLFEKVRKKVI